MATTPIPYIIPPDTPREKHTYIVRGMNEVDYHAHVGTVSSTGIRRAMRSARTFLEPPEVEDNTALRFGRLAHKALLEPEEYNQTLVVMPEFIGYTKDGKLSAQSGEAREKKARWLAEQHPHAMIGTQEEIDDIRRMVDAILEHDDARMILEASEMEVSGFFRDPRTGLWVRTRKDLWDVEKGLFLFDFKTAANSRAERFARAIWDHKYNVQLFTYAIGAHVIMGKVPEHVGFIVIEKKRPFEVEVLVAREKMMIRAKQAYEMAMDRIAEGVRTGIWPRRSRSMRDIDLPGYTDYE